MHRETPLNIDYGVNNERQGKKIMKDRTVKQVQFWGCLWNAGSERRR
jgi:hypothetical protein